MSARRVRRLSVVYTKLALRDLDEIFDWNAEHYGRDHAARYIELLRRCLERLSTEHDQGRFVVFRTDIRLRRLGSQRGGHGHLAIYRVDDQVVSVLRVFHTAQDWPSKLP